MTAAGCTMWQSGLGSAIPGSKATVVTNPATGEVSVQTNTPAQAAQAMQQVEQANPGPVLVSKTNSSQQQAAQAMQQVEQANPGPAIPSQQQAAQAMQQVEQANPGPAIPSQQQAAQAMQQIEQANPGPAIPSQQQAAQAMQQIEQANPGPVISGQSPAPTPSTSSAIASKIGGQWSIVQVGSTLIERDEEQPYLTFEPSTGRFYANNGCNTLNGTYMINGKDIIEFFGVISTLKLCPDVPFEGAINRIIADNTPSQLKMTQIGTETFIDILDTATHRSALRLRRGNMDFLNGNWEVSNVRGIEKMELPVTIFIDLDELKIHGNAGCNYFNGTVYMDHHTGNAIDFSNIALTKMACPYTAQETAFLVALEQTATAIEGNGDTAILLDSQGNQLMILTRIPFDQTEGEEIDD